MIIISPIYLQIEDWLTHYLTQLRGERPGMVSLSSLEKIVTGRKSRADFHGLSFDEYQLISPLQDTVRELRAEVKRFSKVCHLVWSTWSVIQVKNYIFHQINI